MRLEKIELQGFKSFADRVQLLFDHDVTAVVGPNGSGKSNIADAVRWVLGEQSVKNLRGSSMVDVIFSGTEKRKPLNFCQVSILFDNADGAIPLDYQKVKVTRRYYRSGESEYLINGAPVRLKDIKESFMDTGIGKEGYSIIGQGRVDELLNAKGEDRRRIFEEASGIVKLRYKKDASQKRLEKTHENLKELTGQLKVQEQSLAMKKDQADRAREGLRLTEMLRRQEFALSKAELGLLDQRLAALEEEKVQEEGRLQGLEKDLKAIEKVLLPQKTELEALDLKIEDFSKDKLKAQRLLFNAESEIKLTEERKNAAAREHDRLAQSLADLEKKLKAFNQEADKEHSNLDALKLQVDQAKDKLSKLKETHRQADAQVQALEADVQARISLESKAAENFHKLDAEDQRRQGVLERVLADRAEREEELRSFERELEISKKALEDAQSQAEQREETFTEIQKAIEKALKKREGAGKHIDFCRDGVLEAQSRVQDLQNQLGFLKQAFEQNEGYYRSVQQLMSEARKRLDMSDRMMGSLADLISVDAPYQTAIDIALGGALQNIVTKNEFDARYLMDFLKQKRIGRVTFLPMTTIQGRPQLPLADPLILIGASEAVECDPSIRGIIDHFLSRTYIVRSMDEALEVSRKYPSQYRIITLDGEVINAWGSMVGGVNQKKQSSLINRKGRLEALEGDYKAAGHKLSQARESMAGAMDDFGRAKADLDRLQEAHSKALADRMESEKALHGLSERSKWLADELEKRRAQIIDVGPEARPQDDLKKAQEKKEEAIQDRQEAESRLNLAVEERDRALALERRADDDLQVLLRDKIVMENRLASTESRIEEANNDLSRDQKDLDRALDMLKDFISSEAALKEKAQKDREAFETLDRDLAHAQRVRRKLSEEIKGRENEAKAIENQVQALDRDLYAIHLKLDQAAEKKAERQEQMCQDYDLSLEEFHRAMDQVTDTAPKASLVRDLKNKLRDIGYFNYASIEVYEEAERETKTLRSQVEDLEKSKCDIEALIQELEKSMEVTFQERFKVIGENFDRIFKILFDGGHAQLTLDNKDVLNSNIEIIAQPPGKALQNMSLLSGGERSLTAVALLFAIFETHPAPFCILDEIDAALDEANIARYTRYLRTFPSTIQFIIITHRKTTMEMADLLYGVTMEEEGVSKVLTLELEPKEALC